MADVEINDLTSKGSPAPTDELEIQETAGGTSLKVTLSGIAATGFAGQPLVCASFDSTGIKATDPTEEVLTLEDTRATCGPASGGYTIANRDAAEFLIVRGQGGANIVLYGGSHPTIPNDINMRDGSNTSILRYIANTGTWNFQTNALLTSGSVTCGKFTSTSIDDSGTERNLRIVDGLTTFGPAGTDVYVSGRESAQTTYFCAKGFLEGGFISLRGPTYGPNPHGFTLAGNIGNRTAANWDYTNRLWDFNQNDLTTTGKVDSSGGTSTVTPTTQTTHFEFVNGNGTVGSITTSGTATAYNTSSDYRLKDNFTPITDALTRLGLLKPGRFNFTDDPDTTLDGFIAHEVTPAVPEAVSGEKDAMREQPIYEYQTHTDDKGVEWSERVEVGTETVIDPQGLDQAKLVPLLVAAVQELSARVEALEA